MSEIVIIKKIFSDLEERIKGLIEVGQNFNQEIDEKHVFKKFLKYLGEEKEVILNDQIRGNYQFKIQNCRISSN